MTFYCFVTRDDLITLEGFGPAGGLGLLPTATSCILTEFPVGGEAAAAAVGDPNVYLPPSPMAPLPDEPAGLPGENSPNCCTGSRNHPWHGGPIRSSARSATCPPKFIGGWIGNS